MKILNNIKNNNKLSFDVKDFDLNFVRGLSLEDGLSTLTNFTSSLIYQSIINSIILDKDTKLNILICGGGRKNSFLIDSIRKKIPPNVNLYLIDDYSF